jgi:hypothetical protein
LLFVFIFIHILPFLYLPFYHIVSSEFRVQSLQFIVHRIFINFHINPFTHQHIYTFTHLHINSLTHSLINPFTHLPIYTFTHSPINSFTHPHIHIQGSISTGKTRQCVEIVEVRKPLLQEDSKINYNTTITANILPQEGMAQGFYLYGGGGILPVAIVFIIFLCSIVMWSTTIFTFITIATFVTSATIATFISWVAQGHYLYGGRGVCATR